MKKTEVIWREILYQTLEKRRNGGFTQQALAREFGFSTSTVFHALEIPRQIGAIQTEGKQFRVSSIEKLLYFWGTHRSLQREIIYQTYVPQTALTLESLLPSEVILGAFTAYRWHFKTAPADYDRVYVYANSPTKLRQRFPPCKRGSCQLFVLRQDPWQSRYGTATPWGQTFADLWSLPTWYAYEFVKALLKKIHPGECDG